MDESENGRARVRRAPHVKRARRGVSLITVVVALAALVVFSALLIPMMGRRTNCSSMITDGTQVRGITQAMWVWAEDNGGRPPLPSLFDPDDMTTCESGRAKDTTANIYAMLIFEQVITPELVVSSLECGQWIQIHNEYTYSEPPTAVEPTRALWDPAFSVTLDPSRVSHASYAHLQPSAERLPGFAGLGLRSGRSTWNPRATTPPVEVPVVAMRGPQVLNLEKDSMGRIVRLDQDRSSVTLFNGGHEGRWDNNVAYADGRTHHLQWPVVANSRFLSRRTFWQDALFADDADDLTGTNAFLGIFTKAGEWAEDFEAAYD